MSIRAGWAHQSIVTFIAGAMIVCSAWPAGAATPSRDDNDKPLIQIGVEVVEVDELKAINLGVKWMDSIHVSERNVPALLQVGTVSREMLFADLHMLENQGAADLLANPKLVSQDGGNATFHAGGEIPYATAGSQGTVSVEFKPYGVNLKISPRLTDNGRIEMNVLAEVSGPDSQNGVSLSGNVVPAIRSREISTQLTLNQGSTLTMAGMIQNETEWKRVGIPGLMHIPLLKYLFSHKVETHRKTSIVVFVTPTLLESPKSPVAAVSHSFKPKDDLMEIETSSDMEPSRG